MKRWIPGFCVTNQGLDRIEQEFGKSFAGVCSELRLTAPVLSPDWNLREAEGPGPSWLFAGQAEVCQEADTLAPTCQGWLTNIYNMFAATGTNATRWCGCPSVWGASGRKEQTWSRREWTEQASKKRARYKNWPPIHPRHLQLAQHTHHTCLRHRYWRGCHQHQQHVTVTIITTMMARTPPMWWTMTVLKTKDTLQALERGKHSPTSRSINHSKDNRDNKSNKNNMNTTSVNNASNSKDLAEFDDICLARKFFEFDSNLPPWFSDKTTLLRTHRWWDLVLPQTSFISFITAPSQLY